MRLITGCKYNGNKYEQIFLLSHKIVKYDSQRHNKELNEKKKKTRPKLNRFFRLRKF